ncbi:unnamed protein product, partial [Iphiclides podalirius]
MSTSLSMTTFNVRDHADLRKGSARGQRRGVVVEGARGGEQRGRGVGALTSPSKAAALTSPATASHRPRGAVALSVTAIDTTSFTSDAFVGHANSDTMRDGCGAVSVAADRPWAVPPNIR